MRGLELDQPEKDKLEQCLVVSLEQFSDGRLVARRVGWQVEYQCLKKTFENRRFSQKPSWELVQSIKDDKYVFALCFGLYLLISVVDDYLSQC